MLRRKYNDYIIVHSGPIVNFVGMTFDYGTSGQVSIAMNKMVVEILAECIEVTPASESLFDVSDVAVRLNTAETQRFRTYVAKLLYLRDKYRPD